MALGPKPLPAPWNAAQPGKPLVIAHRAGGNEAPENTLAAVQNAQKAGSKIMQMDVLQTSDGVPVVFHDLNMQRATSYNVDIRRVTAAQLPKYKETLEPLLALDGAKPLHTPDFGDAGRMIPTLEQLLQKVAPETHLILEFWDDNEALITRSAEIIRAAGMQHRITVGNPFDHNTWRLCRKFMPDAPTIMTLNQTMKLYAFYMLGLLRFWRPPAPQVVLNIPLFTGWEAGFSKPKEAGWKAQMPGLLLMVLVRFWAWLYPRPRLFTWLQERGIPVVVFIHNRPGDWDVDMRLKGITAIQTDCPTQLAAYLAAHGKSKAAKAFKPGVHDTLTKKAA